MLTKNVIKLENDNSKIKTTILDLKVKLGWAERCYSKMKQNKTDLQEIQDNFCGFLAAFQQTRYYFENMLLEKHQGLSGSKRKKLKISVIEGWKTDFLNNNECMSWNVLNELRNGDTHRKPVQANYEIKNFALSAGFGKAIWAGPGKAIGFTSKNYLVAYQNIDYDMFSLTENGISTIKKLIDFVNDENNWH